MSKEKSPPKKNSVLFVASDKSGDFRCEFTGHPTILEVAIRNNVPLNHSCGGMGSCTTCKVFVREGLENLSPPEDVEAEHVRMRGFAPHERLACQNPAFDGMILEIPKLKKRP